MALTGRSLASVALLATASAFFVPVFADAASSFTGGSWKYAPYLQTTLDQFPLILALLALVAIGGVLKSAT